LAGWKSIHRGGTDAMLIAQPFLNLAGDRLQMRLRCSRANDKIIGEARDSLKIENDDVLGFFIVRVTGAGFR
jgi:hypothetical protein